MITSRDNPKLKLVRKLETRRQRDKLGQFVAEGEDLVAAALEGGWELEFALVDAARPPELALRAEQVSSHLLAEVSTLGHAPRVIGVFRTARPERKLPPLGLELWRVGDPGNVGTLARACDAFGAYLALSPGCADPFGPKSLRSAVGVVGAVFLVLRFSTWGATALLGLPHGVYVTLFGCVLPNFFAGFLAAAWLLRILAGALGGSGGGGHRVPAPARS